MMDDVSLCLCQFLAENELTGSLGLFSCPLYHASTNLDSPPCFDAGFIDAVAKIPTSYEYPLMRNIFETFGTHVALSHTFGLQGIKYALVDNALIEAFEEAGVDLSALGKADILGFLGLEADLPLSGGLTLQMFQKVRNPSLFLLCMNSSSA
jgi:hypothetical protein